MGEKVKNRTFTENEMPTNETSLDANVDFFGSIASARSWNESDIIQAFENAMNENPLIAMKTLFYARDIRGGQGERRIFRVCLEHLCSMYPEIFHKNLPLVPMYGRWDDMFGCSDRKVLEFIKYGLTVKQDGLLAKWLPRKGGFANDVRNYMNLTPKQYRKIVVGLSKTVEQKMCANEWKDIELAHVPSVAMTKYNKAFWRHIPEKFESFLQDVKEGKATIHADTLYPYDLYRAIKRGDNPASVEEQWKALPNYMEENKNMVLPMCDTSGSMTWSGMKPMPIDVCVSLGIYISERNEGSFQNAFLTFSGRPEIQYLYGSLSQRIRQLETANWEMNTNLEAAFKSILDIAKNEGISQEYMPDTILILSDMQFDVCTRNANDTALQMIKRQYEESGYRLPQVVFWNLNAMVGQSPVTVRDNRTCIVSGCSPVILKSVLDGSILSPRSVMLRTILSERYAPVMI